MRRILVAVMAFVGCILLTSCLATVDTEYFIDGNRRVVLHEGVYYYYEGPYGYGYHHRVPPHRIRRLQPYRPVPHPYRRRY